MTRTQSAGRLWRLPIGWLAAALAFFVAMAWGMASAVGSSPDDDFHLASIWCAWGSEATGCTELGAPPAPAQRTVSVPALWIQSASCAAFHPDVAANCAYLGTDGTPVVDAPDTHPMRANNGDYPRGYYAFARLFVTDSVGASVVLIRWATAAVSLVLLVLAGLVTSAADRWRLWLYYAVGCVPLGLFVFSSTNPSAFAIAGAFVVYPAALAALQNAQGGRPYWQGSALAAAGTAIAMSARSDAIYFCALALLCAVLVAVRAPGLRTLRLIGALAAPALVLLVGWITQPPTPTASPAEVAPVQTLNNLVNILSLYIGDFATRLGWLDTSLPSVVWGCVALALGAIVGYGIGSLAGGKLLAALLLSTAMVALPLFMLRQWGYNIGAGVQPRYLFPLVGTGLGLLAVQGRGPGPRPTARQLAWIALLGSVAHALALHTLLRRYITGLDVSGFNLNVDREWWWEVPISPLAVWIFGTVSFTALLVLLVQGSVRTPGAVGDEPAGSIGSAHPPRESGSGHPTPDASILVGSGSGGSPATDPRIPAALPSAETP